MKKLYDFNISYCDLPDELKNILIDKWNKLCSEEDNENM